MKFKTLLISLAFISFLSACNETSIPVEGQQYQQLPTTLNSEKFDPVTEVFSLGCGHCKKMEAILPELEKSLGQDIAKMHIVFNQSAQIAAMFYYAAEMQTGGVPDHAFMNDLFDAIQMPQDSTIEQKKAVMGKAFESRGLISPFNYDDQQTELLLKRVDEIALLSEQSKINAVPTFIVKGKYQVITAGHGKTEEIAETIKYLLTK
ncbi:thiol:disulfide interchange protein DsbA/DsbL [Psychromonas sp. Urea-02u-13]|uniref:thiol:disulfide interchange protein DsbA/DsbL n=1 Tax=Psychromonas sp. Urea-02u-13 TaxID=2058326 RepID=UPI000C34D5D1|nr:thiol:disulfide interchange protein DsbA/DsbL [Psychromonas sp. Urea-02u-13]PKG39687.1 thiol-disulfide isomerase [Psychromonas sp. Urea-02u-13]